VAKLGKPGKSSVTVLIALTLITVLPGFISGQARPAMEIQHRLEGISEGEKEVLETLFVLSQEIEEMDREQQGITREMEALGKEVKIVAEKIENRQRDYKNKLDVLKQVLVSYQRNGPASYLSIILRADNLSSFLRSINIIRDLTRNTRELLDRLEQDRERLMAEREGLAERIALLEAKGEDLEDAMAKKRRLRAELEAYLNSLKEEGDHYRELLANLQDMWDRVKELVSDIINEFNRIIGEGKFPIEELDLKFSLLGIRGTIREETLNSVYRENSNLDEIVFHFYPGRAEIEVPEKQLVLAGTFIIEGGSALEFVAEEGSLYGMKLERASLDELFRDGYLCIDFGAFLDITLQSVKVCDGYLEFTVKPLL
jgi:peptidoglycan hydrolase CwlO-like protein